MALPSSGQLGFGQIATELYGSTGSNRSLRDMSANVGFSTPDAVSEFYGYSKPVNEIDLYWAATTTYYGIRDYYRIITHSGQPTDTTITVTLDLSATYNPGTVYIYYSKNSTSTWTLVYSSTSTFSGSYTEFPPTTSGITLNYADTLRIRIRSTSLYEGTSKIYLGNHRGGSTVTFNYEEPKIWTSNW